MVTLSVVATGLGLAIATGAASADPQCVPSTPDPVTGEVKCVDVIHTHGPTGPSDPGPSGGPDLEARWTAFGCDHQAPYEVGYEVTLDIMNQIPPENYDVINADTNVPNYRFLEEGVDYYNVLVHCGWAGAPPGGVFQVLSGPELNPGPDPIALRTEALAKVTIPEPPVASNPPHDEPDRFGLVHIPTWFWLEAGYWDPLVGSATDPTGAMTVTVTATPLHADWDPGDGSPSVRCFDAGVEWSRGMAEEATDCRHTYMTSSAGQAGDSYVLGVAVEWEYTWAINGVDQGPFATTTLASQVTYGVGEIQAVAS